MTSSSKMILKGPHFAYITLEISVSLQISDIKKYLVPKNTHMDNIVASKIVH